MEKKVKVAKIGEHIYFTSDDEIKQSDWFLVWMRNNEQGEKVYELHQAVSEYWERINDSTAYSIACFKVVATTNPELWCKKHMDCNGQGCDACNQVIAKIDEDFLKVYVREYNKGPEFIIKEVLLETNRILVCCQKGKEKFDLNGYSECERCTLQKGEDVIKLKPNGTCIIHRVKEKTYTRAELINITSHLTGILDDRNETYYRKEIERLMKEHYPE